MENKCTTNIQKLIGESNYGSWAFAVELLLIDLDLWDCVSSTYDNTKEENKKRDNKARAKICLSVSEHIYPIVQGAKTAWEAWSALKKAYADSGLIRRLSLLRKLFSMKLEKFSDMESYVTEIKSTQQALQNIDAGLDDEFVAIIMLAGLTEAYNPLVMAIEHSGTRISSENVTTALLREGQRQKEADSNSVVKDDSVLVSRTSSINRSKNVICHLCKKRGHYKWQCKKPKDDDKKANMLVTDFVTLVSSGNSNSWIIDSGATSHMTNNKDILAPIKPCAKVVTCANNDKIVSTSEGNLELKVSHEGRTQGLTMNNILVIPKLVTNLMSVGKFADDDKVVVFDKHSCKIFDKNVTVLGSPLITAPRVGGLYVLGSSNYKATVLIGQGQDDFELWHRRLGHLSQPEMMKLRDIVKGLVFNPRDYKNPCIPCSQGKLCSKKFPKRKFKRASHVLELVHSDIAGPMEVETWGGKRYMLIFVDDYSRKVFGYFLKCKSDTFECFREFRALVENQTGHKIKKLRSDNGGEYTSKEFQNYLKKHGIIHQTSVPHTPQQNGIAERTIRTLTEKTRCMLSESKLNKRFWGEAMRTAIYLKNRSPTMALQGKVPEQIWTGEDIDISHLKIFGSKAQVLIKDGSRKKLDPKTRELTFIGYSEVQKGYRFCDVVKNPKQCIIARDAVFDENYTSKASDVLRIPCNKPVETVSRTELSTQNTVEFEEPAENVELPSQSIEEVIQVESATPDNYSEVDEEFHDSVDSNDVELEDSQLEREVEAVERRYPLRNRVPNRQEDFDYSFMISNDPISVKDAMERSDKTLWLDAMQQEYDSLIGNQTWELVDRPRGVNVVKCKWRQKIAH